MFYLYRNYESRISQNGLVSLIIITSEGMFLFAEDKKKAARQGQL